MEGEVASYGVSQMYKNSFIYVGNGDLTQTRHRVNAIVCPISSSDYSSGEINQSIKSKSGDIYFPKLNQRINLKDLQTFTVKGGGLPHLGNFDDVIFVVDNLASSVEDLVYSSLVASRDCNQVCLPLFRTGSNRGVIEKNDDELAFGLAVGLDSFLKSEYRLPNNINFIGERKDSHLVELLINEIKSLLNP